MDLREQSAAVLAFDVGGANIKAADGLGWTRAEPFALWRHPADLPGEVGALRAAARDEPCAGHAAHV